MLASPFARQREATSAYSHYHTGMQEQTQKTWRGLDVISDVKSIRKDSQDTPCPVKYGEVF